MKEVRLVRVFPFGGGGGNPAPIVLDAAGMTADDMQRVAEASGHESGFVLPPDPDSGDDLRLRFFVPRHEMEMCAHATIGALWLLREVGAVPSPSLSIDTLSGSVRANIPKSGPISISQPTGTVVILSKMQMNKVLDVLRMSQADLSRPAMLNASTSRAKTLVPLRDIQMLHNLEPEYSRMEAVCAQIGSTGLYPFAPGERHGLFHARQFPRSSGYPEDAATGIAAAALAFGLLEWQMVSAEETVTVRQGEAMGRASEITVTFELEEGQPSGCWISGICHVDPEAASSAHSVVAR